MSANELLARFKSRKSRPSVSNQNVTSSSSDINARIPRQNFFQHIDLSKDDDNEETTVGESSKNRIYISSDDEGPDECSIPSPSPAPRKSAVREHTAIKAKPTPFHLKSSQGHKGNLPKETTSAGSAPQPKSNSHSTPSIPDNVAGKAVSTTSTQDLSNGPTIVSPNHAISPRSTGPQGLHSPFESNLIPFTPIRNTLTATASSNSFSGSPFSASSPTSSSLTSKQSSRFSESNTTLSPASETSVTGCSGDIVCDGENPTAKRSGPILPQDSSVATKHHASKGKTQQTAPSLLTAAPIIPKVLSGADEDRDLQLKRNAFFWAYRERFMKLVSPDNAFFTELIEQSPSKAAIEFKELSNQPSGIKAQLKPYQLTGLSFLVWLYHNGASGILADEMGLGKTLQILSLLQYLKENERRATPTSVVVCPLSVLGTWMSEAQKFTPNLKICRLHGTKAARENQKKQIKKINKTGDPKIQYDLIVTTYETVMNEITFFSRSNRWAFTILDEGHRIKNHESKVSTAIARIKDQFRFVLTGTPIQNDLEELWSILAVLYPKVFVKNTAEIFQEGFDLSNGKVDDQILKDARNLLKVIMLRRTKGPAIDLNLPPKHVVHLRMPLTPMQRAGYLSIVTNAQELIENSGQAASRGLRGEMPARMNGRKNLQNMVQKLRQVCSHPYLYYEAEDRISNMDQSVVDVSSKFIFLSKLIEEVVVRQNQKLIIFSEWHGTLDLVEQAFQILTPGANRFKYLRMDGNTGYAKRNLVIKLFQDMSSEYRILIMTTMTGNVGITLTAASSVVFLEENWNPQNTLQAEARAHRLGQDKPVTIYKMYTYGTVEEQMLGRIQKKLYLSHKVTEMASNINLAKVKDNQVSAIEGQKDGTLPASNLQLRNLIKRGSKILHVQQADVETLLDMDFEQLVKGFNENDIEGVQDAVDDPLTEQEELEWLSAMEKIKCAEFEGQKIQRTKPKEFGGQVDVDLDPKARRVGKERTVMVDGLPILKDSLQCGAWESVSTLTSPQGQLSKSEMKNGFYHEKHCRKCGEGQDLLECANCPRAFHKACTIQVRLKPMFRCGHHKCKVCEVSVGDAGGMLYRCQDCESAFCEDCVNWENITLIGESLPEFDDLQYDSKGSAWFIKCGACLAPRGNESDAESGPLSEISTPASVPSELWFGDDSPTTPSTGQASTPASSNSLKRKLESLQMEEEL